MLNRYTNQLTVMGRVVSVDTATASFQVKARSDDTFDAFLGAETAVQVLTNLDEQSHDAYRGLPGAANLGETLTRYVKVGQLVLVEGILMSNGDKTRFDCRALHVLYDTDGKLLFETSHWWITQITRLCDRLIADLWGGVRVYDYAKYRTNLDITGAPSTDGLQEIETLGRLIYGFATAYMLSGNDRYLDAAGAGVAFQREYFRSMSHDGRYVLWASWKNGSAVGMGSQNGDDWGAIAAYEQIYAIAGVTQYYRATLDPEALNDIRRTVDGFDRYFLDTSPHGGYFSHIDPADLTHDSKALNQNCNKKNWNSIGDHIPAYLVNLLLALKPLPKRDETRDLFAFVDRCERLLRNCSTWIIEKFPDPDPKVPYVHERFYQDWTPDSTYSWQQDRAVCGHNLKIAWNLTRVAQFYHDDEAFKTLLLKQANKLATDMSTLAIDQVRGGVFDVVERHPQNGMPQQFTWWNTKDFWQQEQGILAYLILYGNTGNQEYLELARETMAFWNTFFLDHDETGVFFRTTCDGLPYLLGASYRDQTSHAKSGYHCYELAYLAHVYLCAFVTKKSFTLNFKPHRDCGQRSINVLPDFMRPGTVKVKRICVNGVERDTVDPGNFKIELEQDELGAHVLVELEPAGA